MKNELAALGLVLVGTQSGVLLIRRLRFPNALAMGGLRVLQFVAACAVATALVIVGDRAIVLWHAGPRSELRGLLVGVALMVVRALMPGSADSGEAPVDLPTGAVELPRR